VREALGWNGHLGSMNELLAKKVWSQLSNRFILFCRDSVGNLDY
jgi:hypothetical protein